MEEIATVVAIYDMSNSQLPWVIVLRFDNNFYVDSMIVETNVFVHGCIELIVGKVKDSE